MNIADKIVMRAVASLIPYANNSREHSPAQIGQIAASIKEFGFTNPVLVDADGGIIAGHGRVLAAQKIGIEEVPTIELKYLTEAQRRAYVIADNKLALNASWNDELLAIELGRLGEDGFDLSLTGFSATELNGLGGLGAGGDAAVDATPEGYVVVVDCASEADQVDLIQRLQAEGRTCRGSIA
ncbi:MAG TPA: ParB/Srx family N-terminal domain-containing protein [Stellaceae bacterium]|nr:ParB/Srx family N-terminal domain-containing protein [Stellaceae bacterium]